MKLNGIFKNRITQNAGWLIIGRLVQMVLSFFIGLLTARYLGPGNYGLINYAGTYTTFFASLCTLGINSVIVKNFIDYPSEEGTTLCTAIILRAISSVMSLIIIMGVSLIADKGEPLTQYIVFLCALGMVFQIFDTFNYWFQAHLQSKFCAIATLIAYIVVTIYRFILLLLQKNVVWFALAGTVDYAVVALSLAVLYKRQDGPTFHFAWRKAKQLLAGSYHFILSGMMVSIYGSTDRFMLKQLVNETSVGFYSTAVNLCNIWVFILSAIIDSFTPIIMQMHTEGNFYQYNKKNRQLYAVVFYISMFVSLCFFVFGKFIVITLYGSTYLGAVQPLKIITWYVAFSYLGVARDAWIVCEHKQVYLKYLYAGAALMNIALNALLIPIFDASGAALASLATQVSTIFVFPMFIRDLRPNVRLICEAIEFKNVF